MELPDRDDLRAMGYTEDEWLRKQQRLIDSRILGIKRVAAAMVIALILGLFLAF